MLPKIKEDYTMLFFELIRVSLTDQNRLSRIFSDEEWRQTFKIAMDQSLVGVLLEGINKLETEQKPYHKLKMKWILTVENIRKSNTYQNSKVVELTRILKADGFRSCIIKGQGVAMSYPDPMIRCAGDIDVWLDASRQDIVRYVRNKFPNEEIVYHHTEFPVFRDVSVEVHFTPSWMYSFWGNRRLQRLFRELAVAQFNNCVELPFTNAPVNVANREFNLVFLLSHIYRHLFAEGIGMRQFVDYFYMLKMGRDEELFRRTRKRLARLGMTKFAGAVMFIMKEVFGLEDDYLLMVPNVNNGRFLLNEVMRAGNFGKCNPIDSTTRFRKFRSTMKRNLRFLMRYPSEVMWNPFFRIWQAIWRWKKGYFLK
jgi:hypothetical protein